MPAYHSQISKVDDHLSSFALLPIRTQTRGPAPITNNEFDIIDETIYYFKANIFFRTYEIKNGIDRMLIYITLYITECLKKLQKCTNKSQAQQELYSLAISRFDIPGDAGFPLNSVFSKPSSPNEADLLSQYLTQIRQETGNRLVEKVFNSPDGKPSKWWTCFSKKRFMEHSLAGFGQ